MLWQLMSLSPLFPFSRVDLANATNPAPCSKSLRLPKPPMALLHTGQTKSETGDGGENERRGGGKKIKKKTKEKKENKSRSPFLELLGQVTAQPNVCAGRTAASQPSSV